jgi:hypothetical protein
MQMTFPYLILRGASYSYRRRIPQDLKQFYSGDFIVQSLKTRDKHAAMIKGEALNTATEKLWDDLRDPEKTIFAQAQISTGRSRSGLSDAQLRQAGADAGRLWKWYHLNEGLNGMAEPVAPLEAPLHLLSQARDLYLRLHEKGTDGTHVQRTNNLIAKVIAACGDKDLTKYTRADARKFSEALAAEGLKTTTIRNYLSMVIAIINRGTQEWQITMTNPFRASI